MVTWNYSNGTQLVTDSTQNIQVSNFSDHYSFVQLHNVVGMLGEQFVCNAGNFLKLITAEVTVTVVGQCTCT